MEFSVGDTVMMKKKHPCGGNTWEILRTGMDFKIKCTTCGHLVMISRAKFEKGVKKIINSNSSDNEMQNKKQKNNFN